MATDATTSPAATKSRINMRLRIPKLLFLPIILFALVSHHIYTDDGFWDTTWRVTSFFFLVTGALGRVWTSAYIAGRKNQDLVIEGPYSLTRNPLYFFSLLAYFGAGLAFGKLTVAFAFVALFALLHWPTILAEESKLRGKFGAGYDGYAASTPRFWPRLRRMRLPESIAFSPTIFNRSVLHSAFILSIYMLAQLIEYGQDVGVIPILLRNVP